MITPTGVAVPEDMALILDADPEVRSAFDALRPDDQRQYVDWVGKRGEQSRTDRLRELAGHIRNHKRRAAPSD